MTQAELHRAVARATGESVSEIKHLGFSIADPTLVHFDPGPLETEIERYLDWDVVVAERETLAPC